MDKLIRSEQHWKMDKLVDYGQTGRLWANWSIIKGLT